MKKNLPIIFATFLLFSCVQDDLENGEKPTTRSSELTSTEFVKGSEDIPLVSNLEAVENENVNFDSESGSLARIDYKSPIQLVAVQRFYLTTLPQMGWQVVKSDQNISQFIRDGEKLDIEFVRAEEEGEYSIVRFSLSSVTKK